MKIIATAAILTTGLITFVAVASGRSNSDDPCEQKLSNVEMRECYTKEQELVNVDADSLANKVAAAFRKDAQDAKWKGPVAGALRKAASSVMQSQKTWRTYRDQHCNAVAYSLTTGSGAGTAYESCLFQLGHQRVHELSSAFGQGVSNQ